MTEDDAELDYLDEALENLEFTEDFKLSGMLDVEMLDNTELDTIIDLEHDDLDDDIDWDIETKDQ